jgi:predicted  nucleic acid-binding Zn-ribbon protein
MNRILTCCLSGIALIVLSSCAKDFSKEISDLDSRINALEKANYATQLASLSSSITSLQSDVNSLKNSVESNVSSISSTLSNIQSQINTLLTKDEFNIYKAANDKAVEDLIKELKGKVSQSDYDSFKSKTNTDIADLITQLNGKVSQSDYNAFVANYYSMIDGVRIDIAGLKSSMVTKSELESYKSEVSEAQSTMQSSIDSLLSRVNGLETSLAELSNKIIGIQTQINNLDSRVWALESKLSVIEGKISSFIEGVQSIVYIPRYEDGASTMWYQTLSDGTIEARDTLEFRVSPADCADALVEMWKSAVSAEAVSVSTRNTQQTVDLPVVTVSAENGKISVVLDGRTLGEDFFSGKQKMKAVVIISDGNNERTSEYVSMVAKEVPMPNNVIYYTSSNGMIITPNNPDAFGARIISNEYKDGRGVIMFDGDVTSVGERAFENCFELATIQIPNSVTCIGLAAFANCDKLSTIHIPNSVTSIGTVAFFYTGLTIIQIPSSVTSIGELACLGCDLNTITVDSENSVYDSRNDCNAIIETKTNSLIFGCKNTVIPNSVTSIADYAFEDLDITDINIPNSVTKIGYECFRGCRKLTSLKIPESVSFIGHLAFASCSSLKDITFFATTPPTLIPWYYLDPDIFESTENVLIYVPVEAVDAYKTAEFWSQYAVRIKAIPDNKYDSNVTWTLVRNAYDDGVATVNGVENVQTLKLGTSKNVGTATIVLPKGTKSVSFYGVSWKGNETSVQVSLGETVLYTQTLAANDGACNNPPYTITVKDSDHYTMTLPQTLTEDMTVTVTTTPGGKTRIILFGIKAE